MTYLDKFLLCLMFVLGLFATIAGCVGYFNYLQFRRGPSCLSNYIRGIDGPYTESISGPDILGTTPAPAVSSGIFQLG